MSEKVFKNASHYILASLLPIAVSVLMLPIYTLYLSPTDYGILALVLSLQAFLPILMTLQIQGSIPRFYFEYCDDKAKLKVFISTILLFMVILSTASVLFLSTYLDEILDLIFPKTIGYNDIFVLGVWSSYLTVFSSLFINIIRVQQRSMLFMKASLSLFFISLIIQIFEVVVYERGAYGVVEATLISTLLSLIVYATIVREFFIFKFNLKIIIEPMKYSLPLIPHALSGLIFMYSDRIILEKSVTLLIIGLYMFSDKIAMVFKTIVNEFNNSFSPYFNERSKQSKSIAVTETQNISLVFIYVVAMSVIVLSLFSVEVVYFLFDERYFETWRMIPLLSSAYVFRSLYCFSSSGLFYEKMTGKVAIITIVSGLVNIALNLWLIPLYGVIAAIYTTIFSFLLTFIMAEIMSYKIFYLHLDLAKIFSIVGFMFVAILFSISLNENFFVFGYIEYSYKIVVISIGVFMGYKMKIIDANWLLKVKGVL